MRILTTRAQIHRVADLPGGVGDFPDYPYGPTAIPDAVALRLLDSCLGLLWPADRDFLNDDGGFVVIFDSAGEFAQPIFGMPPIETMESVEPIDCGSRGIWWHCMVLNNNETSVDFVFSEAVAPAALLVQLNPSLSQGGPAASIERPMRQDR